MMLCPIAAACESTVEAKKHLGTTKPRRKEAVVFGVQEGKGAANPAN